MQPYVIEVAFDDGWKILFEGRQYGPYATKADAVSTASEWAENGRKQGHQVTLSINGRERAPAGGGGHPTQGGHAA
jgi:hypothetical protein